MNGREVDKERERGREVMDEDKCLKKLVALDPNGISPRGLLVSCQAPVKTTSWSDYFLRSKSETSGRSDLQSV